MHRTQTRSVRDVSWVGRRIRKVVTNAGDLDGTTVYYYNGQQMIETRDGSGNVLMQVIHGTRYIDEVVQLFLKDAGRVYVHQGEAGEAGRTRVPRRAMSEEKRARGERQGHEPARRERGWMPATRGANYNVTTLTDTI